MKNKDYGEVLKKIAIIFGVITVSACIITAIVLYANVADTEHYHSDIEKAAFTLWGNIFMFGGTIGNAVIAIFMYGLGELITYARIISINPSVKEDVSGELPEI